MRNGQQHNMILEINVVIQTLSALDTHHHECVTLGQCVFFQHPIILSLDYDNLFATT